MTLKTIVRAVSLAFLLVVAAPAWAATQPPASQEGFVPVDQLPTDEEFPATPLVAAAYGIAWAAVLVYVWSVWRRLQRVDRELAEVARRLEVQRRSTGSPEAPR
ncbi:MAG TPA: CcmD family protein [Vicinamibacterales bacterium]|nr:CcmD family protein [Vicinamibacterales bacterium]